MKSLKLSIVIPAYNEESYIQSCLQAIAQQSVKADEVLVVDNNSTDKTIELAGQFDFVTIINEQRQGLFYSRQTGMDTANGDVICRIDADTIVDRNWIREIKKSFQDKHINAMTGPFAYYDMPLPDLSIKLDHTARMIVAKGGYVFMAGSNMAMTKSAWVLVRDDLCNKPYLFEDIDIVQHLRDYNIKPVYNPKMKAAVSARRFADRPHAFAKYIGGHTRTIEHHGNPTPWGVHFAEGIYSFSYFVLKPLHASFDPEKRRPSLSYLLKRRQARPDPMATK